MQWLDVSSSFRHLDLRVKKIYHWFSNVKYLYLTTYTFRKYVERHLPLRKFTFKFTCYCSRSFLWLSLANDPKSSLPDSFTVCSSLLVKFQNAHLHLFGMYKKDGSHWFNMHMSIQSEKRMVFRLFYVDPLTGSDMQV